MQTKHNPQTRQENIHKEKIKENKRTKKIRRAASGVSDRKKKLLLYILYIVSIVFLLPRARGARPPQGPGDPPWGLVKNNVFHGSAWALRWDVCYAGGMPSAFINT